jgi:hypothetical protein
MILAVASSQTVMHLKRSTGTVMLKVGHVNGTAHCDIETELKIVLIHSFPPSGAGGGVFYNYFHDIVPLTRVVNVFPTKTMMTWTEVKTKKNLL